MRVLHATTLTLCAGSVFLAAADTPTIRDVRLGFYGMPKDATVTYTETYEVDYYVPSGWWYVYSHSGTEEWKYEADGEWDSSYRVKLSFVQGIGSGRVQPLLGVGLAYDWAEAGDLTQRTYLLDLDAGAGVVVHPMIHAEAALILGIGYGSTDVGSESSNGFAYEYGARIGVYGTFNQIQVGLEAGWISKTQIVDAVEYNPPVYDPVMSWINYPHDYYLKSQELEIETSGAFFGLTVGARL